MIYLGDARIFKCVKWDREDLGENSCCSRKSVLAGARSFFRSFVRSVGPLDAFDQRRLVTLLIDLIFV